MPSAISALSPAREGRSVRLAHFFASVVQGKRSITRPRDASVFLEAICAQSDGAACVASLVASKTALDAVHASLKFDISPAFINGPLRGFLSYLRGPEPAQHVNDDSQQRLLALVIDPPTLWNATVELGRDGRLSPESQHLFAWLVLQLLSWESGAPADTRTVAQEVVDRAAKATSASQVLQDLAQRVAERLHQEPANIARQRDGPGGRHDNDFAVFREIAIYPTQDELASKHPPFYHRADAVESSPREQRVEAHLENQFRLLREDALAGLRDDLDLTKGRRGATKLRRLALVGFHCGTRRNRKQFCLTVTCKFGLKPLATLPAAERKAFLQSNPAFLQHRSFGYIVANGSVVASATVERVESLLLQQPPVVTLQVLDLKALERTLSSLKFSKGVDFVLSDKSLSDYEPVLDSLRNISEVPLAEELFSKRCDGSEKSVTVSSISPKALVEKLESVDCPSIQELLKLPEPAHLDPSQRESLLSALKQSVSLIHAPPVTSKSHIGAWLSKALHEHTSESILLLCHGDRFLDQLLSDVLDSGIDADAMVRLGTTSSTRIEGLCLFKQSIKHPRTQTALDVIRSLGGEIDGYEESLKMVVSSFTNIKVTKTAILDHLEFDDDDSEFFYTFEVPEQDDGERVIANTYLYDRWSKGQDAGILKQTVSPDHLDIWNLDLHERKAKIAKWTNDLLSERTSGITAIASRIETAQRKLQETLNERDLETLRQKRIIACTMADAVKHLRQIQRASPSVVIVLEAGSIPESHLLTAMTPSTKQLILIGNHKQLRPEIRNYALTVEKGTGFDLNRSLFERLILAGFPHTTLTHQHRMHPEIASLLRQFAYPSLVDTPNASQQPPIRGLQSRVIFWDHQHLERVDSGLADRRDRGSQVSIRNEYEVEMVWHTVQYLTQQGRCHLVVLTPCLGQLSALVTRLNADFEPLLGDADRLDLARAGRLPPTSTDSGKKHLRISTIDNWQTRSATTAIVSLTRSNKNGDIGFLACPERFNTLISRARSGLILIGNGATFRKSRKGRETWGKFMEHLSTAGLEYDGLPVKCEQHPEVKSVLKCAADFNNLCPDGGCSAPCGVKLSCGEHECPRKCHRPEDHSRVKCQKVETSVCREEQHITEWVCSNGRPERCDTCADEAKEEADRKRRRDELDKECNERDKEHQRRVSELEAQMSHERRLWKEEQDEKDRQSTLQQLKRKLEKVKNRDPSMDQCWTMLSRMPPPPPTMQPPIPIPFDMGTRSASSASSVTEAGANTPAKSTDAEEEGLPPPPPPPAKAAAKEPKKTRAKKEPADSEEEEEQDSCPPGCEICKPAKKSSCRKQEEEPAKKEPEDEADEKEEQPKQEPDTAKEESEKEDLKKEPTEEEPKDKSQEGSCTCTCPACAAEHPSHCKPKDEKVWTLPDSAAKEEWEHQKKNEGACSDALDSLMDMIGLETVKQDFLALKAKVDAAKRQGVDLKSERLGLVMLGNLGTGKTTVARLYAQFLLSVGALPGNAWWETTGSKLASEGVHGAQTILDNICDKGGGAMFIDEAYQLTNSSDGYKVLDMLYNQVEALTGKVVFIVAGSREQMLTFFTHNPEIATRFTREIRFRDYSDEELMAIMKGYVEKRYSGRMKVDEGGIEGLYGRIVARRIGRGRGRPGFQNARAVQNMLSRITERQASRLRRERRAGKTPDDLLLTREDMLGPEPSDALKDNASWVKLQEMVGLGSVKQSIRSLFDSIQHNYKRELKEEPPIDFTLNNVFLGNPGTGKTTVARLYGQILADIGLLSNGELVVETPAEFIGEYIGESEAKTKAILNSAVGKVLVIDEAYGLYDKEDIYKKAIINTLVSEVQGTPGDDRCVLLLGYREQMEDMFQTANPGLTRRFPLDSAFVFDDFTGPEIETIFDQKLAQQGFKTTPASKKVALEVLQRARNRPHFGNASEIDILLNAAKLRHQQRMAKAGATISAVFEQRDFDPDFDRIDRAVANVTKLFEGTIGCADIVDKLQGYQTTVANMKALNLDPREHIPFAFLFSGPPGTGKTTTARRMGKVYYDMGFLASDEVVECSATDLVGEYIGHTGPKTQKVLERALGKVLFIDEAYRLAEGHFTKEAMDEIVDCITKPRFHQKQIIILAGYDADINRLMATNPGLTSRFPETLTFRALKKDECVELLAQLLKAKADVLDSSALDAGADGADDLRRRVRQKFDTLSTLTNWASARDVQSLVKLIFGKVMRKADPKAEGRRKVDGEVILEAMDAMYKERGNRELGGSLSANPSVHALYL